MWFRPTFMKLPRPDVSCGSGWSVPGVSIQLTSQARMTEML